MNDGIAQLDWIIIFVYLFGLIAFSAWLSKRQHTRSDYYVSGRDTGPVPIAVSIMATQCSSNSILGAPAFVAFAAGGGLVWLQYELAVPLAMIVIMVFMLPVFYKLKLISVYDYLERRFDLTTRLLLSGLFQFVRAFATAVTVYSIAIVVELITGLAFFWSVLLLGAITVIYDVLGGIRAVIYSDVLQMVVLVGVLVMLLALLVSESGGFAAMLDAFPAERREPLDFASHGIGDGKDFAFWPMLFGGFFLYVSYYGCDQSQVQRELCARSQAEVQQALWLNGLMRFPLVLLYCFVGVGIGVYAAGNEAFVASLAGAGDSPNYNLAVPVYIIEYMPVGIVGIALVALFAAAMSSLDSVINSLSAVTMEDFIKRCGWASIGSDRVEILWSKALTAIWGVLAIVLAFWVDDIASTVLVAVNKLGSLINGPLLAVFVMGLLTQSVTGRGARMGFVAGFVSNLLLWLGAPEVSWLWWNVSGFLGAVAVGVLCSRSGAEWVVISDTVWTRSFFLDLGFERSWARGYVTLAGAACGFLLVLGVFGVR